jgi:LPS O-antigen subunit length determinant protein (WzzB/FepE family)
MENSNTEKDNQFDEKEIELIDLIIVIWKWKYLIILGTFLFACIAAVYSFYLPKIYNTEMVLRPGLLNIGADGKNVYIDTPENIKALIEAGTFNNEILNSLKKENNKNIPKALNLKVTLPKKSNTLKTKYETADIELGVRILTHLDRLLKEEYKKLVNYFRNEIKRDLTLKKAEIDKIKDFKKASDEKVKRIARFIDDLNKEVEIINRNTDYLNKERSQFLKSELSQNNILSALLYANTIQQNLQLAARSKKEISEYEMQREMEMQSLRELESEIQRLATEIDSLKFKMENIQNIQTLQAPLSSAYPIGPDKKLNVILAAVIGFFVLIFISFVLEYIVKNKSRIKS